MYFTKTIKNLVATLVSGLLGFGLEALQSLGRSARNIKTSQDLYVLFAVFGTIGVVLFGRLTYRTLRLYLQYRDIAKDIKQIGDALLNALVKAGVIHTNTTNLAVSGSVDEWGAVYCHLDGGSTLDKSIFINALQEVVAPVDNPRYLIIRKSRFMRFITQRDYHAVPEILGRNKNLAEYFQSEWIRLVGACHLVFTRTISGRKLLLKSRVNSLAAQFDDKVERVNKWR